MYGGVNHRLPENFHDWKFSRVSPGFMGGYTLICMVASTAASLRPVAKSADTLYFVWWRQPPPRIYKQTPHDSVFTECEVLFLILFTVRSCRTILLRHDRLCRILSAGRYMMTENISLRLRTICPQSRGILFRRFL